MQTYNVMPVLLLGNTVTYTDAKHTVQVQQTYVLMQNNVYAATKT